tara:strand:+ start:201 stop:560 length:360 start_codon:yes stop_codon:yes gene_type:complete
MKKLIKRILREEIDKSDRHYRILDKITDHVQLPYFKSMEGLTIYDKDDQEYIMEKILGNITINLSNLMSYNLPIDTVIDDNGNRIYQERSDGKWWKWEYDDNGIEIYYENSYGYIEDNR